MHTYTKLGESVKLYGSEISKNHACGDCRVYLVAHAVCVTLCTVYFYKHTSIIIHLVCLPEPLYTCLLDIPRQTTCMKLGIGELCQPIHRLPRDIPPIYPDRTAFSLAGLMLSCLDTATYYKHLIYMKHILLSSYTEL